MWKYISKDKCNEFLISLNLFDCNDNNKYIKTLYSISNRVWKYYRVYKIKKRNGNYRTIYEPNKLLKHIQRNILTNILNNKEISMFAKAYHKGISLKDNAEPHVNKDVILKLDIIDFFENIRFIDIYESCFPIEYYPKQIGMLLTIICTYDDHLTQGSPTSAYISNLVMKEFDEHLGNWCISNNISYTRYSDDMTFSGNFNPSTVISKVRRMLYKLHLKINNNKIHVIYKNHNQSVTGITVNEKIQVCSRYRKKIRQEVYFIKKYGLESHLDKCNSKANKKTYINKLYGKILHVLNINDNDIEFKKYKDYIYNLKKTI